MTRPPLLAAISGARPRAAGAALGATLLLSITACADGEDGDGTPTGTATAPSAEPTGEAATTIELQLRAEPEEAVVYEAVVAAYEEAHPEVDVDLVALSGDDHITRLTTAFASGEPPDVFLLNYREFAPFVERGAVEPIGSLLDADLAAYYQQPLEAFTIDGELQCMPQNVSSLVVYYNVAMFETAGLPHPIGSWTWEQFADAARALTTDGVHGVGIDPRLRRLAPFIWSNGGEVVDDTLAPTTMTLASPQAREALQLLIELQGEGVSPTRDDNASAGLDEQFINGTLAMYLSSRVDTPQFREQGIDFDVAPMPVLKDPVSILHTDAYCLAAGLDSTTANHDAAVDFISFAVSQQGQSIAALGGRTVPSLVTVAESPAFLDPTAEPASSQVFLDAIPLLRRTPVLTTWPEIEDVVDELLGQAFYDDRPLDEVLVEINEAADPLLEAGAIGP